MDCLFIRNTDTTLDFALVGLFKKIRYTFKRIQNFNVDNTRATFEFDCNNEHLVFNCADFKELIIQNKIKNTNYNCEPTFWNYKGINSKAIDNLFDQLKI